MASQISYCKGYKHLGEQLLNPPKLFYVEMMPFITVIQYNVDIEENLMKGPLLIDLSLQSSAFSYINCLMRKSVLK